jgi:hypothetical protein
MGAVPDPGSRTRNFDDRRNPMSSRWLFPPDPLGDGAAQGLVAVEVSAGLVDGPLPDAVLVAAEQQCRERELELRVMAITRGVLRVFRVTGPDVLFAITPT